VEPEGDPAVEVDGRDGPGGQVLRVGDGEGAGVQVSVVGEAEQPTVVLGRSVVGGHEHRFVLTGGGPEVQGLLRAAIEVVLRDAADGGGVAVAMAAADDALVDPRELLWPLVDDVLTDLPARQV